MSHKNLTLAECCKCHETKDCRPFGERRAGICYECAMKPENRPTVVREMVGWALSDMPALKAMIDGLPDESIQIIMVDGSERPEQMVPGPRVKQ